MQLISFGWGLDALTSGQLEETVSIKGRLYAQIKTDKGQTACCGKRQAEKPLFPVRALGITSPLPGALAQARSSMPRNFPRAPLRPDSKTLERANVPGSCYFTPAQGMEEFSGVTNGI